MKFEVGTHMTLVLRGRSIIQGKYTLIMSWTAKLPMTIVSWWCLQGCFWPLSSQSLADRLLMSLISREFQPNHWARSVNHLNLHWPCSVTWPVLSVELNFVPKFHSCSLTRLSQSIVKVFALVIIELSWCLLYLGHGGAVLSPSAQLSWAQHTSSTVLTIAPSAYPGVDLNNYPGRILTRIHQYFYVSKCVNSLESSQGPRGKGALK